MRTDEVDDVVLRGGDVSFRSPWWFSPGLLILLPVGASFLAWLALISRRMFGQAQTTSEALTGFSAPAHASGEGIALLVLWYCAIVLVSMVGYWLGADRSRGATGAGRTDTPWFERRYFFLLLAFGAIGVGYSFLKVGGYDAIAHSVSDQTANDFSNKLSGFAGLQTFRYATILSAPVGVFLWRKRVVGWPYMILAVLSLMANAVISSRLALLMACAVYLTASVRGRQTRTVASGSRARTYVAVLLVAFSGFAMLTALNYVRNANYYRDAGVSNPVAMNLYQSGAYLAIPAQVSLGVSDAVVRGAWENQVGVVTAVGAVQPTFLQFNKVPKDDRWKQSSVYGFSVTFAGNFFTNSVFADTYSVYGAWGWFYTIIAYGVAGYAFARIISLSTVLAASAGIIAYCFLEVWRIQILTYGIVVFLLLLTTGSALLIARFRSPQDVADRVATSS